MAAHPIYVETEEEIPEVVERLRRMPAEEVPIVVPARSRLGQSRFNFQLLRHYAAQLGKRVSIISTEAAVQQMAQETGLEAFGDVEDYGSDVPAAVSATAPPSPRSWLNPLRQAPKARVEVKKPEKMASKRATDFRPGQLFLYSALALVLVMGMLALAIYVPSASITLVAQAAPFEQPNIEIQGEPGKPPVRIRTLGDTKQNSQGFKSTGYKETPALQAIGNVVWTNSCDGTSFTVPVGQSVSGAGYTFAVTIGAVVGPPGTPTAAVVTPVKAAGPGVGSNVGAHTVTSFYTPNTPAGRAARECLTVTNPEAMAGGQDAKKEPQMTQSDFDAARSQLEQELRKEIGDDLNKQIQPGEKLSDLISFEAPDFATDHKPGDLVATFGGTMTLHGEGAYYIDQDVRKALEDTLKKRVPVGNVLTDDKITTEYRVSHESPGGHLTFLGGAHAFMAPQMNYEQIRNRLAGKPMSQARTYLESLPVRSVTIVEKPLNLPFMPLLVSRIDLKYKIQQSAPRTPPG